MLVLHHALEDPPPFIRPYLALVKGHLRDRWTVALTAYDDQDPGDPAFVSAAVVATTRTGLRADVSRHAGADVVQVRLFDSNPVPFEDLAVAKGDLDKETLLAAAKDDNGDDGLPSLEDTLSLIYAWTPELPCNLRDQDFMEELGRIADDFMAALPVARDRPSLSRG